MASSCHSRKIFQALALLPLLLGTCCAARTLQQGSVLPCGEPIPNTDLPGDNLPGSGADTASNQACLDLCMATTDCNAYIRVFNGDCFLKNVPFDVVPTPRGGMTSYIICDGMAPPPEAPAPAPAPGSDVGPSPAPSPVPTPVPAPGPAAGGAWRALKPLPVAMGEVSSGVLTAGGKDYLVVVGEHENGDPKNGVTMIYDISEDVWIEGGARPEIGNHHSAEVIGNQLYLIGGLRGTGSLADVQIGTLSAVGGGAVTINWVQGADAPVSTGSAISALIDGEVYYCGGITGSTTVAACQLYDPASDTWSSAAQAPPDMPVGRNHAASCTDGTNLYNFGGRDGGNVVGPGFAETQVLSPGGGWALGTDLPLNRGGMGKCVCTGGACYVFGGEVNGAIAPSLANRVNTARTVFRTDIYDVASNSWSLGTDMPEGLHGIFPVLHNDRVYIAGGGTRAAFSQSTAVYEYTPEGSVPGPSTPLTPAPLN